MELLCVVILFLVVFAISAVKRYSPALWERARLPLLIFISIGSAVLILLLIFAACVMVQRDVFSAAEKVLYCMVDAGLVGFISWINFSDWKKMGERAIDRASLKRREVDPMKRLYRWLLLAAALAAGGGLWDSLLAPGFDMLRMVLFLAACRLLGELFYQADKRISN